MTTTRPGFIWSGTEWVAIGQEAVVAPVSYQTSAPSTPATGDIWIDSDDDVPSVDSTLFYRWTKTMSGGETSLSGSDNNSLTLKYTPGYEELFINGVLQVRGSDYVATTGTSITGLTALSAGDVVMIQSTIAYSVGDTYTQAQIGSLLDAKSPVGTTGLVLLNTTTFTTQASVSINNVFLDSYENYKIVFSGYGSSADPTGLGGFFVRLRVGGVDASGSNYTSYYRYHNTGGANTIASAVNTTTMRITDVGNRQNNFIIVDMCGPKTTNFTNFISQGMGWGTTTSQGGDIRGIHLLNTSYDGFTIYPNSGTITGTVRIYGIKD